MRSGSVFRARLSLALVLLATGLTGCGPQPQDCRSPRIFCAGLVSDYGDVSTGLAHEAWLGLQDAKDAGLVDRIDQIETIDSRDRQANIEAFASEGYDMIVTVGFSMGVETTAAAKQHPNLLFLGVEQPQNISLPNLAGLVFHEEKSGFLAGVLAALTSRTHRVAAVCESEYLNPIRRYCEGFRSGAVYGDPSVHVSVQYRDGSADKVYQDTEWGASAAVSEVQQGADVVFATGGDTAAAALKAAAEDGATVIGSETDLYGEMPTIRSKLLTCSVSQVREGVMELVKLARDGRYPSGQYFGQVGLSAFHDFEAYVPADVRARILQAEQALDSGDFQLDIPYDNP